MPNSSNKSKLSSPYCAAFGPSVQSKDQTGIRPFHALFGRHVPTVTKIRLVKDNLNTLLTAAFYEVFPAQQAFQLAQRFEFDFTPKSASWLNMIEIEFSALSKQRLQRRIPNQSELENQSK